MIRAQGGVRSHRRATVESVRYCLQVVVVAERWWFRADFTHRENRTTTQQYHHHRTYTTHTHTQRHPPEAPDRGVAARTKDTLHCYRRQRCRGAHSSAPPLSPPLKGSRRDRIGSGTFRPRTTPALNATLPVTPTSQSSARLNPSRTAGPAGASDTTAGAYLQDSGLCSATAVSHCLARSCNLPSIRALCGLAIATAEVPPHVACFISCTPLV